MTDGVQSAVVRPENNIIVSLNGVIQEPGVAFNLLVGSRIIFAEVPRVGSTFVAFSYVGSEADVDAETVIPPIEPGDFIDIGGETADREVAVIESSNSLITFDYLGSVFGKDAAATANITKGTIRELVLHRADLVILHAHSLGLTLSVVTMQTSKHWLALSVLNLLLEVLDISIQSFSRSLACLMIGHHQI